MGSTLSTWHQSKMDPFRVNYPYYGLFGAAEVRLLSSGTDMIYECTLLNGKVILLNKSGESGKWVDTEQAASTPLALIIGRSIDDFLKNDVQKQ